MKNNASAGSQVWGLLPLPQSTWANQLAQSINLRYTKDVIAVFRNLSLAVLLTFASLGAEPKTFRAARSVHLQYQAPEGTLFFNEAIVEKSVNGSYFMACGWDTGYFGIQQLDSPEDKVVLFSVWDPTKGDNPNTVNKEDRVEVLDSGDGVRIKRFGGEGTGAQSMWRYPWRLGETNQFIVQATIDGEKTSYAAFFRGTSQEQWKHLATFRTRTGGRPLRGYYSFVEDFRRDGKSVQEQRRARFGNGWIRATDGQWLPLRQARFTASHAEWESPDNIDAGTEDSFFFLATGGEITPSTKLRSLISLSTNQTKPPDWLAAFSGH